MSDEIERTKATIETISGVSLADVSISFRSSKPKQVGAKAYTKGTDVFIGPGQEELLAHELWHVTQQKRRRIPPTSKIDEKPLNDDPELEREADRMGRRVRCQRNRHQSSDRELFNRSLSASTPIQRVDIERQRGLSCWFTVLEAVLRGKGYSTRYLQTVRKLYPSMATGSKYYLQEFTNQPVVDRHGSYTNAREAQLRRIERSLTDTLTTLRKNNNSSTTELLKPELWNIFFQNFKKPVAKQLIDAIDPLLAHETIKVADLIREVTLAKQTAARVTHLWLNKQPQMSNNLLSHYIKVDSSTNPRQLIEILSKHCPVSLGVENELVPSGLFGLMDSANTYRGHYRTVDWTTKRLKVAAVGPRFNAPHNILIDHVEPNTNNYLHSRIVLKDPIIGNTEFVVTLEQLLQLADHDNDNYLESFGVGKRTLISGDEVTLTDSYILRDNQ